jgi:hypothetical protein
MKPPARARFEKASQRPRGRSARASGDIGGLEYGNADTFMQEVFAHQTNERLDTMERRVNNVHGDDMVEFVRKNAK